MYTLHKSLKHDIVKIAECHRACFKNSLSTKLGNAYSTKALLWFLSGSNRFLLHVENEDTIAGYVGGFVSQFPGDGSTSGMLRYAMQEAVWGVCKKPAILFHPQVREMYPLIFKNFYRKFSFNKKRKNTATQYDEKDKKAGLVVIGVLPSFRGQGVFEILMSAFEKEVRLLQINQICLSVKKNNPRALHAYQKCGWQIVKEHEDSFEMCKQLVQD